MAPQLWHLPVELRERIHSVATGAGVRVAVLDTGMSPHPDLPTPIAARSFVPGEQVIDGNGHGTHCCGTSVGRNGIGLAAGAKLIVGKVLSDRGSGNDDGIVKAIYWAIENGADVISMSLGGGHRDPETEEAISYAWTQGCYVNAAAGNSGFNGSANTIGHPAKFAECICQGATQENGEIAGFSSGGREMDWACPGQQIISCSHRGGGYVAMSGTSMATPFGSALLGVIKELQLREGAAVWSHIDQFREFIKVNATDIDAPGHDPRSGHGVPLYTQIVDKLAREDLTWV